MRRMVGNKENKMKLHLNLTACHFLCVFGKSISGPQREQMFSAYAAKTTVKWTLKCIVGIVAGLVVFFIVLGVQAAENPSSEGEDGGAPGQTVTPVELVIYSQTDGLDKLDGIKHQTAGLQNHCEKHRRA